MIRLIEEYISSFKKKKKFKISIIEMEKFIERKFENLNEYDNQGGYSEFYKLVKSLESQKILKPVNASRNITNGKISVLPVTWWVIVENNAQQWSIDEMMIVSSKLNLEYFKKNPKLQTTENWTNILKLYEYLKLTKFNKWVSKEERAYQIFGNEKYFDKNEEGRKLLSYLGLSLEFFKIKDYGEPFVYWVKPNMNLDKITRILITENLSFFHTCRRYLKINDSLLGVPYEMVIYGEGTHIENSLPSIKEIIEHQGYYIDYVGDIDPTGISIYCRLKEKYPNLPLRLAIKIYQSMIQNASVENPFKVGQNIVEEHYEKFFEEIIEYPEIIQKIQNLRECKTRIPQETISIEQLEGGK